FVALFFVAIGALVEPRIIVAHWPAIVAIGLIFCVVRFFGWAVVARMSGFATSSATLMALAMVPLGEFNIVLRQAASTANRIDATERSVMLGIVFLSIFAVTLIAPLIERLGLRPSDLADASPVEPAEAPGEVLIIGFGRVGRTVAAILTRLGLSFSILERD